MELKIRIIYFFIILAIRGTDTHITFARLNCAMQEKWCALTKCLALARFLERPAVAKNFEMVFNYLEELHEKNSMELNCLTILENNILTMIQNNELTKIKSDEQEVINLWTKNMFLETEQKNERYKRRFKGCDLNFIKNIFAETEILSTFDGIKFLMHRTYEVINDMQKIVFKKLDLLNITLTNNKTLNENEPGNVKPLTDIGQAYFFFIEISNNIKFKNSTLNEYFQFLLGFLNNFVICFENRISNDVETINEKINGYISTIMLINSEVEIIWTQISTLDLNFTKSYSNDPFKNYTMENIKYALKQKITKVIGICNDLICIKIFNNIDYTNFNLGNILIALCISFNQLLEKYKNDELESDICIEIPLGVEHFEHVKNVLNLCSELIKYNLTNIKKMFDDFEFDRNTAKKFFTDIINIFPNTLQHETNEFGAISLPNKG